jgi:cyclic beta-1,2-glucan synthetase
MPTLLVDEPVGSLLHAATEVAVAMQREQGRAWHLPWGVSESAHAERDASLAYQYGPQGAPALALRRTLAGERVIAPYASMLALQVSPWHAWRNLRRLEHRGARDRYGFIEALDHTRSRQQSGTAHRRVAAFMAHHQGMSLVALTNTLHDNVLRRWFMADPQVAAMSALLQEPVPGVVRPLRPPPLLADPLADDSTETPPLPARSLLPGTRALEPVALLTNGRLSTMLRPDGAGALRWMGLAVSRWRDDALRGEHGLSMFVREVGAGAPNPRWHSITQHPAPDPRAEYRCEWQPHAATFEAVGPRLTSRLRVWVAPQEDVEVREVTIEHHGDGAAATVELASYFEVVLAAQAADEAHPAFSNLFVQARWDPDLRALWFTRRGRLEGDATVHAVHFIAACDGDIVETRAGSDRTHALGRGGSVQSPRFERQADAGDTGLDPIASIAVRCVLPARGVVKLRFATAVAHDPALLAQVVERHRQRVHADRAWRMASALALIALREARIDAQAWHAWQLLCAPMAQWLSRPGSGVAQIDRRCLWHFGLSGERALLLVRVPDADGLLLADWVARVTPLWARAGLAVDVVLLDTEPVSYLQPVQQGLARLVHAHGEAAAQPAHSACRLLLLRAQDLSALELQTLRAVARLDLLADGRAPGAVMHELRQRHAADLERRQAHLATALPWLSPSTHAVRADAPVFDADSGACRFAVDGALRPQRAWANVLANAEFGTHVTEGGGGHCWAHNSRLLQITPSSNDPLADPAAEWLLLQDQDSGRVWNAWPAPCGAAAARYAVEHGPGWSAATHVEDGIEVSLQVCVDRDARIKQSHLRLRHAKPGGRVRRLRVVAAAFWQLGARWADRASVQTAPHWCSPATSDDDLTAARNALALLATQTDAGTGFAGSTAFLALRPARAQAAWGYDWTCDRRELFDARGRAVVPEAFGQRSGSGMDPCAALALDVELEPGREQQVTLLLGHADSREAAQRLAETACAVEPAQRAAQAIDAWRVRQGGLQVHTPDPLFDALVNHWLRYQTLACRLWARAGFYQIGGAYGYRDQLQDAMALTALDPGLLRDQILLCASRQFAQGDVQHWWHPPEGAGVRTKFSDDLLWLVAALLRHLDSGGDATLLDARVPWLEGRAVPEGAEDLYETPQASVDDASVFEHAARALDRSLAVGAHGLPLMGAGDWNDGMNRVGIEGRGESVWLAWFLVSLLEPMAALATQRGEADRAQRWRAARRALLQAVYAQAWDGAWYRRAFFDDGSALGSAANRECRIDLIAQAWAVLAGGGDEARARQALQSAAEHLIDADAGLVRLLDPPLAEQQPSAGYIQAYPRGVRENGGQYTHAAAWAAMAFAQQGDAARAWQAWQFASPAHRLADDERFAAYRIEPYAVAGDVYGHAPWRGRGGWSWYTGAAGWLQRAAVESLLGVQQRGGRVRFVPLLPPHWPQAQVVLQRGGHAHVIDIVRAGSVEVPGSRSLAAGAWLDLDALDAPSRWTVTMTDRPGPLAAPGSAALQGLERTSV